MAREPDYVVFYWTGKLPETSALSILSALSHTRDSKVLVYLDSDNGFESSVPHSFNWTMGHERLTLIEFSLKEWVLSGLSQREWLMPSKLRRFLVGVSNPQGFLRDLGRIFPA